MPPDLRRPTVDDWQRSQLARCRGLSTPCPTARSAIRRCACFWPAACPRSCCTCASLGLLDLDVLTVSRLHAGRSARLVGDDRRGARRCAKRCVRRDGIDPDDVIMSPARAAARGPDQHGLLSARQSGARGLGHQEHGHRSARRRCRRRLSQDRARRASSRANATPSPRSRARREPPIKPGDVHRADRPRPAGLGHGRDLSDHLGAQASGLGTRSGRGHRRALFRRQHRRLHRPRRPRGAGRRTDRQGARRRPDSHRRSIAINWTAAIDLVGDADARVRRSTKARACLAARPAARRLAPDARLPDDTRLWAALQRASGGTWGGCVYDVDRIVRVLEAGERALAGEARLEST